MHDIQTADLSRARSYHFVGVGGIGMSALAAVCAARGCRVSGSDRSFDAGARADFFQTLAKQGIELFPQDGSALAQRPDVMVASTAIEDDNPEVRAAREQRVGRVHRSEVLAHWLHAGRGIAVTGTSGKTTVTAMIGWVLHHAGLAPTIINGGFMCNFAKSHPPGNAVVGGGDFVAAEADESDGTVVRFSPEVGVVTSVSRDHKEIEELLDLFRCFASQVHGPVVINADCPLLAPVAAAAGDVVTYGFSPDADVAVTAVQARAGGSAFEAGGHAYEVTAPGRHNVSNAAAAIAVAQSLGLGPDAIAEALAEFSGVRRRLEVVERVGEVCVIDDYAHNPEKVAAAISAVQPHCDRLVAVFQPHGFGPTRFMREELVRVLASTLRHEDVLWLAPIYYAGGTADKSVSSADLAADLGRLGVQVRAIADRDRAVADVAASAVGRAAILVMGARDDTLTDFCRSVSRALRA